MTDEQFIRTPAEAEGARMVRLAQHVGVAQRFAVRAALEGEPLVRRDATLEAGAAVVALCRLTAAGGGRFAW